MQSEKFGRLLKAIINSIATQEGKTNPIIEDELGQKVGVSAASIQRYKAGHIPPEVRTIEMFAEAAIKRGGYSREWLQNFLHSARHPHIDKVLDQLCPINSYRPRSERIYHNLPAPTYSQFVMREQPFNEILDGLSQRSAVVLLAGMGGMGKTSLALEIADYCIKESLFDAAVWVSDKDQPGTTTLSIVLDDIARTLDYPGLIQFEHEEKRYEVEQLVRRQRVLLLIDNFETITDGALLSWLLRLPEPSKALLTTREYRREFRRSSWPIELRGMTNAEAQELTTQKLHQLKIDKQITDLTQLAPLLTITSGNPKAIEMALGYIKYQRQPLEQVINDLYVARGELFEDLFARCWSLLDEASRRVLLVMTFFPDTVSSEALSTTADVQGFAFDRAVEHLIDLTLLDVQQEDLNKSSRYGLHPLVRVIAIVKLLEQSSLEAGARERWVDYYVQLAMKVGYPWEDLNKLKALDTEFENVFSVLDWTFKKQHYSATIKIANNISYYHYIRGIWARKLEIEKMRAEAARKDGNTKSEIGALSSIVGTLSRQGRTTEARVYLERLNELENNVEVKSSTFFNLQKAIAYYYAGIGEIEVALMRLQRCLPFAEHFNKQTHIVIRNRMGNLLYQLGDLEAARQLFLASLEDATKTNYKRGILYSNLKLLYINLDEGKTSGILETLEMLIKEGEYSQSRDYLPLIYYAYYRLSLIEGNIEKAISTLKYSIDLFEKLGMRNDLKKAREELANLETAN
ncbi:MAG TPA: NB-ARC domain-containing protein [Chloroflexia bacterium]|nr:NB-ARC domain-containing protein [Chloroflexia bacterium]